jgi:hypothetical protein
MTTHETLKEIADMIWFNHEANCFYYEDKIFFNSDDIWLNEIEIIFTPDFMEKFVKYYDNKTLLWPKRIYEQLWLTLLNWNLHDPTSYLANLLGIWIKKY